MSALCSETAPTENSRHRETALHLAALSLFRSQVASSDLAACRLSHQCFEVRAFQGSGGAGVRVSRRERAASRRSSSGGDRAAVTPVRTTAGGPESAPSVLTARRIFLFVGSAAHPANRALLSAADQIFGSQDFLENGVAWHRRPGSSKLDDTDLALADASREDPNGHPGVVHRSFLSEPVSERRFLSEKRLANIACIIEFTELEALNDGPDKGTPFERRFLSPYACVQ